MRVCRAIHQFFQDWTIQIWPRWFSMYAFGPDREEEAIRCLKWFDGEGTALLRKVFLGANSVAVGEPLCSCVDGEFEDHRKSS